MLLLLLDWAIVVAVVLGGVGWWEGWDANGGMKGMKEGMGGVSS
jgi:hypothetical protein